ncbi:MAG: hypothetical protein IH607_03380, partial [Firmicutes bacterium]|nr:hypothetical protein [Bacillota bacterium]
MVGTVFRLQVYLPGLRPAQMKADPEVLQKDALLRAEAIRVTEDALRQYKLVRRSAQSGGQFIVVEFARTSRAVKHMAEFMQTVASGLAALGIQTPKVCKHCGQMIESGEIPVKIGYDVFPMHDNCAEDVLRQSESGPEKKPGSVITGTAGALLAAIVGSLPWALIFALGYMASIVGLLIGFMVDKGYDLFHGRQGRAKIVVVVLCVLLSVALGQFLGTSYTIAKSY